MTGFVQIVEIQTSRIDEVRALSDRYRDERMAAPDADASQAPVRAMVTADRDRPGHYLNIVEFDSYEKAMENSERPETSEFAAQLAKLCDAPPKFYNLDVMESWTR